MKLLKDIEGRLDPSFLLGGPFNGGRHETPKRYREAFPIFNGSKKKHSHVPLICSFDKSKTNIKIRAASAFL